MESWPHNGHSAPKLKPDSSDLLVGILCIIATFPSLSFATDRMLSLSNGCALPGNIGQAAIRLSNIEGLAGCDLEIAFDPNYINVLDVSTTPITEDFLLVHWSPMPGFLRVSMASAEGLSSQQPGIIALISLEMASGSSLGTRTPIWYRKAHWYTELSIRQSLQGDNAVFLAGTTVPGEDGGIVYSMDSPHGAPGSIITTSLSISLPAGVSQMEGVLTFDPLALSPEALQMAPLLKGWSQVVHYDDGLIHFTFNGPAELNGPDPIPVASWNWFISPEVEPGNYYPITVSDPRSQNLEEFHYVSLGQSGGVTVGNPQPTPTPDPLLVRDWLAY